MSDGRAIFTISALAFVYIAWAVAGYSGCISDIHPKDWDFQTTPHKAKDRTWCGFIAITPVIGPAILTVLTGFYAEARENGWRF